MRVAAQVRERVSCATKVYKQEDSNSQRHNINTWYQNMADAADMVLDEECLVGDPSELGGEKGKNARMVSKEAARASRQLNALLQEPLAMEAQLQGVAGRGDGGAGGQQTRSEKLSLQAQEARLHAAAARGDYVPKSSAFVDLAQPAKKFRVKKQKIV